MKTLALDLGTNCGYAMNLPGSIVSGVWDFKAGRFSGGGMRYLRFRQQLEEVRKSFGPDIVVFEEVRRHRGTDAAHVYGGLLGILTAWCEEHSIPYEGVTVQAIKTHATGKGNASKEQMIEWCIARGCIPKDDNEADARVLLDLKTSCFE